jgi:hypothetical protein
VTNRQAVWALLTALLALAVLAAGAGAARLLDDVGLYEAIGAVPVAGVLALVSISLARRARLENQRTLGRAGGGGTAALARVVGTFAFLVALTAALALGVFAILALALE